MNATLKGTDIRERFNSAINTAKEVCEGLENKTVAAAKATDKAVRKYPYPSIGIAFGLGLLIGGLTRLCRRH